MKARDAACRTLIVNADDFGLSEGVNEGIVRAFSDGIVRSTSLMVHAPAARDAAELARSHPDLGVGLHIDLGEWEFVERGWRPLYQRVDVTSSRAVEQEIRRQLDQFVQLMSGGLPTHIDSHQHVHLREPLRTILIGLARELGVPLRQLSGHANYCGDFYGQDSNGLTINGRLSEAFLTGLIHTLPQGVLELCCHPASRIDFGGMYRAERLIELEVLCGASVKHASTSVDLGNFRTIAVQDALVRPPQQAL